ncbi:unnamed protein product, partial [Heligmosomoides polygyrus]|uniref:ULP_PROTEASE domain-containing protein n=1 Tax=Heligmosomoides polygyrus TaxID=6339 RepID=A0A183FBV4_HELPZ
MVSTPKGRILERGVRSAVYDNSALQTDTWSCGYRSIACMVDLARQRNPLQRSQRYSIDNVEL